MGVNWIYGIDDNLILDLVKEIKIYIGVFDSELYVFDEDGIFLFV